MKSIFFFVQIDFPNETKKTNHFANSFKIAGKHFDTYEAYYRSLDPKNTNAIQAMDAARFLKKSGLSDVVLSRVSLFYFMGDVSTLSQTVSIMTVSRIVTNIIWLLLGLGLVRSDC